MAISGVSFGKVIIATGSQTKIKKINGRLDGSRRQPVIAQDVTKRYKYASTSGPIAQAAQRGEKVSLFITREDTENYTQKKPGWETLDDVLAHMSSYIDTRKTSVDEAVEKIFEA